ncbi:neuromedin-K receptor-like [Saccostrea echinata]|uniref:neuromedin-K receptor-like n=1 Tax=Saccostrea echinata TaxID=191078 RepID=UPI002A80D91D|nr:neuromedin-K receptor-like [Saccostrea echinata]
MSVSLELGIFLSIISMILIFAVVSNFLVVIIVARNKKMRSATNIFIGNLSLSDIILGAFVLPQNLHDLTHAENFHEGEILCKIVNGFPIFCITASIFTLVALSCERKHSIVHSLRPQLTLTTSKKIVVSVWVLAGIVSTPSFVEYSVTTVGLKKNVTIESCGSTFHRTFSIFNGLCVLLLAYVIPLIIMWYNYVLIIKFVMKKTSSVRDTPTFQLKRNRNNAHCGNNEEMTLKTTSNENITTNSTSKPSTSRLETIETTEKRGLPSNSFLFAKRMKIIKMLILVAVLFAICWLPYFVSLVIAKMNGTDDSEDYKGSYNLLKIFLATFSVGYNVILYVIFNPNFRKAILDIIYCRGCKKRRTIQTGSENKEEKGQDRNKMHVSSVA